MSGKRLSDLVKRDLTVDPMIEGVTADSRKVKPGYLFAALSGAKSDGREFVAAAIAAGEHGGGAQLHGARREAAAIHLGARQRGEQPARPHLAAVGGDALDHRVDGEVALQQV